VSNSFAGSRIVGQGRDQAHQENVHRHEQQQSGKSERGSHEGHTRPANDATHAVRRLHFPISELPIGMATTATIAIVLASPAKARCPAIWRGWVLPKAVAVVGLEDASKGINTKRYKQPGQDSLNQHANLLVLISQMQERRWGQFGSHQVGNAASCFVSAAGLKIGFTAAGRKWRGPGGFSRRAPLTYQPAYKPGSVGVRRTPRA
jgi:hypothetical protein